MKKIIDQSTERKFMQTTNQLKSLPELLKLVKYEDFATVFYTSVENSSIFTVLQKKYFGD